MIDYKLIPVLLFGNADKEKRKKLKKEIWNLNKFNIKTILVPFLFEDFIAWGKKKSKYIEEICDENLNLELEKEIAYFSERILIDVESPSTSVEVVNILLDNKKINNKKILIFLPEKIITRKNDDKKKSFVSKRIGQEIGFVALDKILEQRGTFEVIEKKAHKEFLTYLNTYYNHLTFKNDFNYSSTNISKTNIFSFTTHRWTRYIKTQLNSFNEFINPKFNNQFSCKRNSKINLEKIMKSFSDFLAFEASKYEHINKLIGQNQRVEPSKFVSSILIKGGKRLVYTLNKDADNIKKEEIKIIELISNNILKFNNISSFAYHKFNENDPRFKTWTLKSGQLSSIDQHLSNKSVLFNKVDIKSFFDSIDHTILENIVKFFGIDKKGKINEFVNKLNETNKGILQGLSSSPLISNIYLLPLDILFSRDENQINKVKNFIKKIMKDNKKEKIFLLDNVEILSKLFRNINFKYTRYSDDILISSSLSSTKSRQELNAISLSLTNILKVLFNLEYNKEKIREIDIKRDKTFKYLGININYNENKNIVFPSISRSSKKRIKKWDINKETSNSIEGFKRYVEFIEKNLYNRSYIYPNFNFGKEKFLNFSELLKIESKFINHYNVNGVSKTSKDFKTIIELKYNEYKFNIEFTKVKDNPFKRIVDIYYITKNGERIYYSDYDLCEKIASSRLSLSEKKKVQCEINYLFKEGGKSDYKNFYLFNSNLTNKTICPEIIVISIICNLKWNEIYSENYRRKAVMCINAIRKKEIIDKFFYSKNSIKKNDFEKYKNENPPYNFYW